MFNLCILYCHLVSTLSIQNTYSYDKKKYNKYFYIYYKGHGMPINRIDPWIRLHANQTFSATVLICRQGHRIRNSDVGHKYIMFTTLLSKKKKCSPY